MFLFYVIIVLIFYYYSNTLSLFWAILTNSCRMDKSIIFAYVSYITDVHFCIAVKTPVFSLRYIKDVLFP